MVSSIRHWIILFCERYWLAGIGGPEKNEQEKNAVSEEDIWSQVGPFQVPQHYEILPLSILGSDQQYLEKFTETSTELDTD